MGRTNVDDDWFLDITKRRASLIRILSSTPKDPEREADGLAMDAWRTAQRYWKDNCGLIPSNVFEMSGFLPLVSCGLAERRGEGYYVRGTEHHHEWIRQRVEAGRRSAKARGEKYGTPQPIESRTTVERPLNDRSENTERLPNTVRTTPEPPAPAPAPAPALNTSSVGMSPTDLMRIWNEDCGANIHCRTLSPGRERVARTRLKENSDPEYWRYVVQKIAAWSWLKDPKCKGWRPDFDYLIRPDTHIKASEGKFDSKPAGSTLRFLNEETSP